MELVPPLVWTAAGGSTSAWNVFFLAGDGIRDFGVSGVQTCALPMFVGAGLCGERSRGRIARLQRVFRADIDDPVARDGDRPRSEERRVGKDNETGLSPRRQDKRARQDEEDEQRTRERTKQIDR